MQLSKILAIDRLAAADSHIISQLRLTVNPQYLFFADIFKFWKKTDENSRLTGPKPPFTPSGWF